MSNIPECPSAPSDAVFDLDTLDPEFLDGLREADERFRQGDPGIPLAQVSAETASWLASLPVTRCGG